MGFSLSNLGEEQANNPADKQPNKIILFIIMYPNVVRNPNDKNHYAKG